MIEPGRKFAQEMEVEEMHLATELGSGSVRVLGTPALLALMESTALRAVASSLDEGFTTVGTAVDVRHVKATPVGMTIRCEAVLEKVEGKKLTFKVTAWDDRSKIGEGTHERIVVDEKKFMARAKGQGK
jgi:predicted thioesterase